MNKRLMFLGICAVGFVMSGCTQQQAVSGAISPDGGYGTPGSYDASGGEVVAGDTVVLDGQNSGGVTTTGVGGATVGGAATYGDNVVTGSNGSNSSGGNGKNSVYFGYDSNRIQSSERSKISSDVGTLKSNSGVKVEGNSDEFGTDEYNYALGLRRAKAVKDEMVARGVDGSKISVVSYGESNPVCADGTKDCYQRNRRADYN